MVSISLSRGQADLQAGAEQPKTPLKVTGYRLSVADGAHSGEVILVVYVIALEHIVSNKTNPSMTFYY
jgi:hypothetical protein